MEYIDFDLAIEPSADGYIAKVFNSPVGQAAASFPFPFSPLELDNFLLRMGRSRHAVRRIGSPEMESAKVFGGRLFNSVFVGDVRGCLRSSMDEATRREMGLRIRLHLGNAPDMADLPWEFLYNPTTHRFFSLSIDTPLVRYLELQGCIRPLVVKPPLRILMMVSSPSDYPKLDVARENAKITEALADLQARGLVTLDWLSEATLPALQRKLQKSTYHIFHFVGHGGFDSNAQDGVLVLEEPNKRGRRVSGQYLGALLRDHRPLRLAVLNACEGARASRCDPFAGTAQSLIQQGIPAVIAMQFEVTDESAICFTHEFYAAIAGGYPVDGALAEARKAIFAAVSEVEWGTPVLYMRSSDARIFDVQELSEEAERQVLLTNAPQNGFEAGEPASEAREEGSSTHPVELAPRVSKPRENQRFAAARARIAALSAIGLGLAAWILLHASEATLGPSPVPVSSAHAASRNAEVPTPAPSPLAVTPPPAAAKEPAKPESSGSIPLPPDAPPGEQKGREPAGNFSPPAADVSMGSGLHAVKDAATRESLRFAVERADGVIIKTYRSLQPKWLAVAFTGSMLATALKRVATLKAASRREAAERHSNDFGTFLVSNDGGSAEVRTVGEWSRSIWSDVQGCIEQEPQHTVRRTIRLKRIKGEWLVAAITSSGKASLQSCE